MNVFDPMLTLLGKTMTTRQMLEYVNPRLIAELFPSGTLADDEIVVTVPAVVDASVEVVGIGFAGSVYLMFFADLLVYASGDEAFLLDTAATWNDGLVPQPGARLVKFFRAEADRETMFLPHMWPLAQPALIWQFSEALADAMSVHATAYAAVSQYFYTPQTPKLDALYNRLARKFERGVSGVTFRCVTRPAFDRGGFYGFERV